MFIIFISSFSLNTSFFNDFFIKKTFKQKFKIKKNLEKVLLRNKKSVQKSEKNWNKS